jgi:hypothetical protein
LAVVIVTVFCVGDVTLRAAAAVVLSHAPNRCIVCNCTDSDDGIMQDARWFDCTTTPHRSGLLAKWCILYLDMVVFGVCYFQGMLRFGHQTQCVVSWRQFVGNLLQTQALPKRPAVTSRYDGASLLASV